MSTTLQMIDAIVARLKAKLPTLAVENFPERPLDYRLNDAVGALLVSYPGSRFDATVNTAAVVQPRRIHFSVTIVARELNGRGGAIDVLDQVRAALVGFRPPDCLKLAAVSETFLGEEAGLWQYALDLSSASVIVEESAPNDAQPLTRVQYEPDEEHS